MPATTDECLPDQPVEREIQPEPERHRHHQQDDTHLLPAAHPTSPTFRCHASQTITLPPRRFAAARASARSSNRVNALDANRKYPPRGNTTPGPDGGATDADCFCDGG